MNGVKWEMAQCTAGSTVSWNFCSDISPSEVCTSYIHTCVPSHSIQGLSPVGMGELQTGKVIVHVSEGGRED